MFWLKGAFFKTSDLDLSSSEDCLVEHSATDQVVENKKKQERCIVGRSELFGLESVHVPRINYWVVCHCGNVVVGQPAHRLTEV